MSKKIIISAMVNLGDVILMTSAIALIKRALPETNITIMVKKSVADAVKNNPVIDEVIVFEYKAKERSLKKMIEMVKELKRRRFDISISLDHKLRPAILTFLAGIPVRVGANKIFDEKTSKVTWFYTDIVKIDYDLNKTLQAETYQTIVRKFFKIKGGARPVFARIAEKNEKKADELLARLTQAKLKIALCVKGTFPLKTWSKEYFGELVKKISARYDAAFYIVGAPNDKEYADEVIAETKIPIKNFCGETNLVDLAAIFTKTDLFVTVDTGATHIAATTGVKMVTMYGCTSPDRWHPINEKAIVFTSREECCPCKVKAEDCPTYPQPKCLHNVTAEMVFAACCKLLDDKI